MTRSWWALGLSVLFVVCAFGSTANAAPLSMTFTEARANVGDQLADEALFASPSTAPFAAQIDTGSGSITAGLLQVPEFSTHIESPVVADVTVDFEIGVITGNFNAATGALTLSGEAGGTLTANGKECNVSTPAPLTLSTTGTSGGANPRVGIPFTAGLTGAGAIAGEWTDMEAVPVEPANSGDVTVCEVVEEHIEGPGGVWLDQEGDHAAPAAPHLAGTDPASPSTSGTARIFGSAEAGSTLRVYASPNCSGAPVSIGPASELGSPGIPVRIGGVGITVFSATATDAAGNTSACSAPISYTQLAPCVVPKLKGKTVKQARSALKAAECRLGKVHRPKPRKGRRLGPLVVKSSQPAAGTTLAPGAQVSVKLRPERSNARH